MVMTVTLYLNNINICLKRHLLINNGKEKEAVKLVKEWERGLNYIINMTSNKVDKEIKKQ